MSSDALILSAMAKAKPETIKQILHDYNIGIDAKASFAETVLLTSGDVGVVSWAMGLTNNYEYSHVRTRLRGFIDTNLNQILKASIKHDSCATLDVLGWYIAPRRDIYSDTRNETPAHYIDLWLRMLDVSDGGRWQRIRQLIRETYGRLGLIEWVSCDDLVKVIEHPFVKRYPGILPDELFAYSRGLTKGLAQATPESAAKKLIDCPEIIGHALESITQTETQEEKVYV